MNEFKEDDVVLVICIIAVIIATIIPFISG